MLKRVIILFFISIIFIITIWIMSHSLLKKEYKIRNNLLKVIPMGTKMEETLKYIKFKEKWEIGKVSYDSGFYYRPNKGFLEDGENKEIGTKYIYVVLGRYYNPFETAVIVNFGFDENDELIEIWVRKQTDSP